jgi:branched-chain amino acid transport system permease protein
MIVLGAYLSYELSTHLGIGLLPGLLITVPAMFVLGVALEFCFMRRLRESDRTGMSILVTFAVAILIEGVLSKAYGVDYVQLHASYVDKSVHVLGFYLPYIYLIGFVLAAILMAGLYYMLYRTKFGRAVRASLQNRTAADLIGINVNRTRTISVGIGIAVTAVGGMVFGATTAFNPNSGYDLISRLLAIVILGGLGSIGGAMAAAILLLVVNDVVAVAWSPTWAPLVFFAVLVVVLSIRPQGLFGSSVARAQ